MNILAVIPSILRAKSLRLAVCAALCAALPLQAPDAAAEDGIVAVVNDEPITSYDVAQRQRFLALTSGFNEAMQQEMQRIVKDPSIQDKFKAFVQRQPRMPQSKEEMLELQKLFMQGLQKEVQQKVMSSRSGGTRKAALEELIDEMLMMQDAKKQTVVVTDAEVEQSFSRKGDDGKVVNGAEQLFQQLRNSGVDPKTFKDKRRVQIAWMQVVRRLYGYQVQVSVAAPEEAKTSDGDKTVYDLRVMKLPVPAGSDQKAMGRRLTEAENIRQRFTTCDGLANLAKLVDGASIKPMAKVALSSLTPDARAVVVKAAAGEMTPPVIAKDGVEAYAVCAKRTDIATSAKKAAEPEKVDKRQQELQIYGKRHLKELRQNAHIEYR
jgi:peptidyl-prolyl cis-trans isomerase SurA